MNNKIPENIDDNPEPYDQEIDLEAQMIVLSDIIIDNFLQAKNDNE